MKPRFLAVLAAALLLFAQAPGTPRAQEAFSFYGLHFGMTGEAVKGIFPLLDGNVIREPGHGMSSLEVFFDREGFLLEIRAGFLRPTGKLQFKGLQRALREKFILPIQEGFPEIDVTLDEFGNQAAFTLIMQSSGIREKNIEHYKILYLEAME